ncbi:MAG: hypothetical protein H7Z43_10150 [Clostridia bacterium]|nr:hypothetical protein [Deltaproteobacteria bacterium]
MNLDNPGNVLRVAVEKAAADGAVTPDELAKIVSDAILGGVSWEKVKAAHDLLFDCRFNLTKLKTNMAHNVAYVKSGKNPDNQTSVAMSYVTKLNQSEPSAKAQVDALEQIVGKLDHIYSAGSSVKNAPEYDHGGIRRGAFSSSRAQKGQKRVARDPT